MISRLLLAAIVTGLLTWASPSAARSDPQPVLSQNGLDDLENHIGMIGLLGLLGLLGLRRDPHRQ